MTIETRFEIGDRVRVIELGKAGTIKGMVVTARGIEYVVRYAAPGEFQEVSFFEDELEGLK